MRRLRMKQIVIVLISCTITLGEIQWISSMMVRDGVAGLDNCVQWVQT